MPVGLDCEEGTYLVLRESGMFHVRWPSPKGKGNRLSATTGVRREQGSDLAWYTAARDPKIPVWVHQAAPLALVEPPGSELGTEQVAGGSGPSSPTSETAPAVVPGPVPAPNPGPNAEPLPEPEPPEPSNVLPFHGPPAGPGSGPEASPEPTPGPAPVPPEPPPAKAEPASLGPHGPGPDPAPNPLGVVVPSEVLGLGTPPILDPGSWVPWGPTMVRTQVLASSSSNRSHEVRGWGPGEGLPPSPPRTFDALPDLTPGAEPFTLTLGRAARAIFDQTGRTPTKWELWFVEQFGWLPSLSELERAMADDPTAPKNKPEPLFAAILFLATLLSMAASGAGLAEVLTLPVIGYISAATFSMTAYLLSVGALGTRRPGIRAPALAVLALVSVVTGFPAYFAVAGGNVEGSRSADHASVQHAGLVVELVAPLRASLAAAQQHEEASKQRVTDEVSGRRSGQRGFGRRATRLSDEAAQATGKVLSLQRQLEALQSAIVLPSTASASDYFDAAIVLCKQLDCTEGQWPNRDDYIEAASENVVILAWTRLFQADVLAVLAFFVSLGIDGFSIGLGFALRARISSQPFLVSLANQLAGLLVSAHHARQLVRVALRDGRCDGVTTARLERRVG